MAKKALVSTIESSGKDDAGYRVLEVVESGNEFPVNSNLQWHNCPDNVEMDKWWYDPVTSSFKKLPFAVNPWETAGDLAKDDDGNYTEAHEWNWDTESYSKVQIV
jgi:hypothetical protein